MAQRAEKCWGYGWEHYCCEKSMATRTRTRRVWLLWVLWMRTEGWGHGQGLVEWWVYNGWEYCWEQEDIAEGTDTERFLQGNQFGTVCQVKRTDRTVPAGQWTVWYIPWIMMDTMPAAAAADYASTRVIYWFYGANLMIIGSRWWSRAHELDKGWWGGVVTKIDMVGWYHIRS